MPANLTDAQCDEVIAAINTAKATIARLTRERDETRRKALEEAAKVAIDHAERRHRLAMEFIANPPLYSEQQTARTAALSIAADIRSLSPQGE